MNKGMKFALIVIQAGNIGLMVSFGNYGVAAFAAALFASQIPFSRDF